MKQPDSISEKKLLDILHQVSHPLNLDAILRISGVSRKAKTDILNILHKLKSQGTLIRLQGGRWVCVDNLKIATGSIAMQRSGSAFVTPSNGGEDFYVSPNNIGEAWNGDTVKLMLLPKVHGSGKKQEGFVIDIITRKNTEIKVRLFSSSTLMNHYYAQPIDTRLPFNILVDTSPLGTSLTQGDILAVRIGDKIPEESLHKKTYAGTAISVIGRESNAATQERITKTNNLIPTAFSDDVLLAAEKAAETHESGIEQLTDLRESCLVTIDGEDAKDFDDAINVSRETNQWILTVAIADVSYFVTPYSSLDKEATMRGNSYYFPTSVEPMLPDVLCNGVCSLQPNVLRRCMAVKMTLDNDGNFIHTEFINGVMCSKARLTYSLVQACLDHPEGEEKRKLDGINPEIYPMLRNAEALAAILISRRNALGGFDFDSSEAEFIIEEKDSTNAVIGMKNRERLFSHRLIEAFMIRANEAVAEFLSKKNIPFLYRIHPAPDQDRLRDLYNALKNIDVPLPLPHAGKITNPKWMQFVVNAGKETNASYVISRLVLRSMMQAKYDPLQGIHFGLASEKYCHFTSPIRRYADLINHRALKAALKIDGAEIYEVKKLNDIAELCNTNERKSVDAEREINKRMGCLLMHPRIGQYFNAVISGVTHFGVFAELDGMPIEGFIRLSSLRNDFYIFDEYTQQLVGKNTGQIFKLGQSIKVKLLDVNIEQMEIDLEYNPEQKSFSRQSKKDLPLKRSEKNNKNFGKNFSKEKKKYFDKLDEENRDGKYFRKKKGKSPKFYESESHSKLKFSMRDDDSKKRKFKKDGKKFDHSSEFSTEHKKKFKAAQLSDKQEMRPHSRMDRAGQEYSDNHGKVKRKPLTGEDVFFALRETSVPNILDFDEERADGDRREFLSSQNDSRERKNKTQKEERSSSVNSHLENESVEDNFDIKYRAAIEERKKASKSYSSFPHKTYQDREEIQGTFSQKRQDRDLKGKKERNNSGKSFRNNKDHFSEETFSSSERKKVGKENPTWGSKKKNRFFPEDFSESDHSHKRFYRNDEETHTRKKKFRKEKEFKDKKLFSRKMKKYDEDNSKPSFFKRDSVKKHKKEYTEFTGNKKWKEMHDHDSDNFFKKEIEEKPRFRFGKKSDK